MLVCALLFAARTGTVTIHLTDAHNRPIPRHEIWLDETNSTKPVRPFGVQWFIPDGPFHGTTNGRGDVAIRGVRLRNPMMVVTKFGPRFDAFVSKNGNASGASLDVIKFEGAVYAGKPAHVVLADDREISGTVTDGAGRPLKGIGVSLSDTGFGHMGGYPGTDLDSQTTDSRGVYRFTRLPNCAFCLAAGAPAHTVIESRVGTSPWELISIVGQEESSQSVLTSKPTTTCDFRLSQAAHLTMVFKGTSSQFKGWTAWAGRDWERSTGQNLDYDASSSMVQRDIEPGQISIVLTRDNLEHRVVAMKLTLKPGESRTVEISMTDVLKHKADARQRL